MDILIGADPEFFVRSKKTGELISAHGLIAGTKANPIPMGPGHAQVDGMALEINVPPSKNAKEFIAGFKGVMNALEKELPDVTFDFSPVAHFGAEMIKDQPREARELGCEPDFSAYTGQANPRPNADTPFRTASGHVHIGWTDGQDTKDPDHITACNMLSKQLDFMLGLPSLIWDEDVTRRQLYGKAGCYRPKHYGMEYRTLSNAWLTDEERIAFVVKNSIDAFNLLTKHIDYGSLRGIGDMINNGKWEFAYEHYNNQIGAPALISSIFKARKLNLDKIKAEEMKKMVDRGAAKGDVNGKGFPANHLAKVAWGKRQVVFNNNVVNNIPPAPAIRLEPGMVIDWEGINNQPARPWAWAALAPAPVPVLEIVDDWGDAVVNDVNADADEDF